MTNRTREALTSVLVLLFIAQVAYVSSAIIEQFSRLPSIEVTSYPSGNPFTRSLTAGYVEGLEILDRLADTLTPFDPNSAVSISVGHSTLDLLDDGERDEVRFVYHGQTYVTIALGRPATICQDGRCLEIVWSESKPYHFEMVEVKP